MKVLPFFLIYDTKFSHVLLQCNYTAFTLSIFYQLGFTPVWQPTYIINIPLKTSVIPSFDAKLAKQFRDNT